MPRPYVARPPYTPLRICKLNTHLSAAASNRRFFQPHRSPVRHRLGRIARRRYCLVDWSTHASAAHRSTRCSERAAIPGRIRSNRSGHTPPCSLRYTLSSSRDDESRQRKIILKVRDKIKAERPRFNGVKMYVVDARCGFARKA